MKVEVGSYWIYRVLCIMSNKDSYWFRHDSTAGRGLKMRKMAHIYKHWGKGVYWDVVEILRDQKDYKFESDESSLQLLCDLIGCKDEARFISWFNDCLKIGLFEIDNGFFVCPPLIENMKRWEASKNNGSKGGRPKKETQKKPKKNLTDNLEKTIIGDKSIEHNRIEEVLKPYFDFIGEVKDGQHDMITESWLMKLKIPKTSLTELLTNDFRAQLITDNKQHKNTLEVRKHFYAFLNKLDQIGKLDKYKQRSKGML